MNIDNIMQDIKKPLIKPDICSIATNIINRYYTKIYRGSEYEKVSLLYFTVVFWELSFYLGSNIAHLKQDNLNLSELNNFFERYILEAKIETYKQRKNLFFKWINNQSSTDETENEILQYLSKLYTMNKDNLIVVKKELGIMESVDDLTKKLRALK